MSGGGLALKSPIAFVFTLISVSCLFLVIVSVHKLPDTSSLGNRFIGSSFRANKLTRHSNNNDGIGKFGEMMVEMLPQDLAFTIFIPSEKAFERDLRLRVNDSLVGNKVNDDTYAVLTRILGFSAVPRMIPSSSVPLRKEIVYDALSGLNLYMCKKLDGMLIVNGVRAERVDLRKGEMMVLHVMDGVIMEADFEQSVRPDDSDED